MSINRVLIAYYSRRGENYFKGKIQSITEGNTEYVAKVIKEICGGDLFEIDTVHEYPKGYTETTNVASVELKSNARPELKHTLKSIEDYEVIFIGYPNWWSTMPMACFTFLESFDFTGKVIVPFCTHEGSGLGNSVKDIKNLCPTALVKYGFALTGTDVRDSHAKIVDWVNKHINL